MNFTQLQTPFLEEKALRSTNFFNGRLLSGEAMTTEQAANGEHFRRLGQAAGSGVAHGLQVEIKRGVDTKTDPLLTVSPGLAVNRCGQTVSLAGPDPVDVALVRARKSSSSGAAGPFGCCKPLKTGGRLTGDGIYLLTISPVTAREGRAPVNGISTDAARCNSKHLVEGVQFNLIPIAEPYLTDDDFSAAKLPYLRNRIAYKCFGVDELAEFARDPLGAGLKPYGLVDQLRAQEELADCEVPLAIIHWTMVKGIEFVDMWAVRRRITRPVATHEWRATVSDRRLSEGEARFAQFQEHARDLLAGGQDQSLTEAGKYFRWLPALVFLPQAGGAWPRGFDYLTFSKSLACRKPVHVEGAKLKQLIESSFHYPPIDVTSQELIWLYFIRENQEAGVKGGAARPQPLVLFVNGHIPYQGKAQFNLSHWSYANYV